jgi:hypothetical protein
MWLGLLPEPTIGAQVSAFVRFAGGMKVFTIAGTSAQQTVLTGPARGSYLKLTSLGAGLCPLVAAWRSFDGHLCARVDLGFLHATGFGFAVTGTQDRPLLHTGATVEVRRPLLGPTFAGVSAGLAVPLLRNGISYADAEGLAHPISRPAAVAGLGEFRLGAVF